MFDQQFLTQKLDKFVALLGINSVVEYEFEEENGDFYAKVFFKGDNLGYAIGYRGKNIDALQFILGMMLRNMLKDEQGLSEEDVSKLKVVVDVGDYREQGVKKLKRLVDSKVDDVRTLGEYIDLPPMSGADRREVHLYIKDFDDVVSESFGEGRDRAVRIMPSGSEDFDLNEEKEE